MNRNSEEVHNFLKFIVFNYCLENERFEKEQIFDVVNGLKRALVDVHSVGGILNYLLSTMVDYAEFHALYEEVVQLLDGYSNATSRSSS